MIFFKINVHNRRHGSQTIDWIVSQTLSTLSEDTLGTFQKKIRTLQAVSLYVDLQNLLNTKNFLTFWGKNLIF